MLFILLSLLFCSACQKEEEIFVDASITNVVSKSYIVLDQITGRVLEGRNIHDKVLPASTTKILTCLTVLNYFDINSYIVITNEMINIVGSKIYLEVGDIILVKDLLYGLMLNSGNDASHALAIALSGSVKNFVYLMNEECKRIGMENSTFENPSGLDEDNKNITTAYDMALLFKEALNNNTFRKIVSTKEYKAKLLNGRTLYFNNKHKLIHTNHFVTGGKTGYTKAAGRTLLTSFKQDDFEIVVATFDCPNDWEVHTNLAKKTFSKVEQIKLVKKQEVFKLTNLRVDKNILLFPLFKNEIKEDIQITIKVEDEDYYLNYYLDESLIGRVKLKEDD